MPFLYTWLNPIWQVRREIDKASGSNTQVANQIEIISTLYSYRLGMFFMTGYRYFKILVGEEGSLVSYGL